MTLTTQERAVRDHVMAINLGRCCLCHRQAQNFAHRLPEGQGGPLIVPNGLPLCGMGNVAGNGMCHGLTENRRALSYNCGWLIRTGPGDETPAARNTRIAATPALIRTQLGAGWHFLDWLDEAGKPTGLPRFAEPGEVPRWMFTGQYEDALALLHRTRAA